MNKLLKEVEQYIEKNYYTSSYVCKATLDDFYIDFMGIVKKTFSEVLLSMIDNKGLLDVDVYKRANIDRRLFSKMRNKDYHPRKNTVIKLLFALELDIDDSIELLEAAGYALSNGNLRDVIIRYFLENSIYNIMTVNSVLEYYKQEYI